MSERLNKVINITAVIGWALGFALVGWFIWYTNSDAPRAEAISVTIKNCPEGSYSIGDGICKLEPTGCPWAEQTPLDQCVPPPDIECNADWTQCKLREEPAPVEQPVVQQPYEPAGNACGK